MSQATVIIDKFGSMAALANALDRPSSVVQGWKERGTIPVRWHKRIIEAAAQRGIDLPHHLFFQELA